MASPGYPPTLGGVEQVVAQSARALARAGHIVDVFAQQRSLPSGVRDERDEADERVSVHRFESHGPHDCPVAPGLWRALYARAEEFDIVHGHSYHTLTGLAASVCSRAPFVFSPHYNGTGYSPLRTALHRAYRPVGARVLARARVVVCVSGAEAGLVSGQFPDAAGKCVVVPNGVEYAPIREAEPFPDEPPTVLSVGRLERYKRVDRLIEAFAQLRDGRRTGATGEGGGMGGATGADGARLVVIGAGPDRPRLTALAGRLGLLEPRAAVRVAFLGRVDDERLHRWLRTCRVLCSFSEHEAFGLAPAEALVAGAPVVLSDIPAHRELAACGEVQLVGSHESPPELAARLRGTLETTTPKDADVAAGASPPPNRVLGWDEVAERLTGIYHDVLASPFGPPE